MFDSTVRLHSLLFIFRSELTAECYNRLIASIFTLCAFVCLCPVYSSEALLDFSPPRPFLPGIWPSQELGYDAKHVLSLSGSSVSVLFLQITGFVHV